MVKNILVHVVVLTVIFIAAVFGFARYVNQTAPNTAQAMENSTFPLVYMQNNGVNYNCPARVCEGDGRQLYPGYGDGTEFRS